MIHNWNKEYQQVNLHEKYCTTILISHYISDLDECELGMNTIKVKNEWKSILPLQKLYWQTQLVNRQTEWCICVVQKNGIEIVFVS